ERGQRKDGRARAERQEGDDRHHAVGQDVAPHDLQVAHAERARGAHVVHLAVAQELGAHVVGQRHPAEQAQQHEQQQHAGREDGAEDDQQVELGHRTPDLEQPLQEQVGLAREEALDRADGDAQHHAHGRERQREQHADAETVDQLRQQVAPAVVGAQQVLARGRGRVGLLGEVIERARAVGIGRVERPVGAGRDAVADEGIEVVGRSLEVAAEGLLGVVAQHREVGLALVAHHQRLVGGQQLREQAQHHQHGEQDQAPEAQRIAAEAAPGAPARAVRLGRRMRRGGSGHRFSQTSPSDRPRRSRDRKSAWSPARSA
ncbi:unnamed protein product, partial [Brugia timori]|uniref:Phenol hydroxylase n=1 Tax=Brugia timori TaxID=42155 RepID=A0A0R3QIZ9_9BILA